MLKVKKGEILDAVNWLLYNSEQELGVWALSQSTARALTQKYERTTFHYILELDSVARRFWVVSQAWAVSHGRTLPYKT